MENFPVYGWREWRERVKSKTKLEPDLSGE
jgi:hypothetical protein